MNSTAESIEGKLVGRDLGQLRNLIGYLEDRRGEMLRNQRAGRYSGNDEARRRFFTFIDLGNMASTAQTKKMLEPVVK